MLRYLKYFESVASEYYEEATDSHLKSNQLIFNYLDIKLIDKFCRKHNLSCDKFTAGPRDIQNFHRVEIYTPATSKFAKSNLCTITKISDDYYLTKYNGSSKVTKDYQLKSFKCDQRDGLIKNLTDALSNWEQKFADNRAFHRQVGLQR